MKGKLLVISGLSAAGKGTIAKELLSNNENFVLSISATTREKRKNEVDGKDYFFVSVDKFEEMIKNNNLLEYAKYVNNYYGTPKDYVERELENGKNVILEIEMQGALKVKEIYDEAILVFFLPKDAKTQRERLINRGRENEDQIKERLKQTLVDAKYAKDYDYVLVNESLEPSVNDIKSIIDGTYDKNKNIKKLEMLDKIVKDIEEENYV